MLLKFGLKIGKMKTQISRLVFLCDVNTTSIVYKNIGQNLDYMRSFGVEINTCFAYVEKKIWFIQKLQFCEITQTYLKTM